MDATQQCVSVCLYLIDGQRHQFLQTSAEGVPEMLEHLRRTKVFGQPNLLVQGDDALSTFPTHAVARLDLLTAAPIPPICPSTWTEAHELTAEEFLQRRLEVRRDSQGHPRERIRDQAHTLLVAYDLLGGYPVYLEAQVIRPDDVPRPNLTASDLGMARQHAPQHTIARSA